MGLNLPTFLLISAIYLLGYAIGHYQAMKEIKNG